MGNDCCGETRKRLGFSSEERTKSRNLMLKLLEQTECDGEIRFSKSSLKTLFDTYDEDKSGSLDMNEVQDLCIDATKVIVKELNAFEENIDVKKKGAVEEVEKLRALQEKFESGLQKMRHSFVGFLEVFYFWDENGDGDVTYKEFEDGVCEWFKIVVSEKGPSRRLSKAPTEDIDPPKLKDLTFETSQQ